MRNLLRFFFPAAVGVVCTLFGVSCRKTSSESVDRPIAHQKAGQETAPPSLESSVRGIIESARKRYGKALIPDEDPFFNDLDSIALVISSRLFMEMDPGKRVSAVVNAVFVDHDQGFDRNQDDIVALLPHTAWYRKQGSCLGNSLILLLLAQKLDYPLFGVVIPDHFFVSYRGADTTIHIETIKGGASFSDGWYRERYGADTSGFSPLTHAQSAGILYYNYGNTLLSDGAIKEAAACYEHAVSLVPDYARAWGNLGIVYEALGENVRAIEAVDRARSLNENLPNIEYNLGTLYLKVKDYPAARREYRRGIERTPRNERLYHGLACAQLAMGDTAQAVQSLRHTLGLDKEYRDARVLLETIERNTRVGERDGR